MSIDPAGRRWLVVALLLTALALASGGARADPPITHAQSGLRVEPLTIVTRTGAYRFKVEVADTPRSQEIGLMYRPLLPPDRGMLFEMGEPQTVAFWMANCPAPLDMLFIQADGRVLRIARNTTPYSHEPIPSGGPVTAVLEIRGGRAAEIGAEPGDLIRHGYFRHG